MKRPSIDHARRLESTTEAPSSRYPNRKSPLRSSDRPAPGRTVIRRRGVLGRLKIGFSGACAVIPWYKHHYITLAPLDGSNPVEVHQRKAGKGGTGRRWKKWSSSAYADVVAPLSQRLFCQKFL